MSKKAKKSPKSPAPQEPSNSLHLLAVVDLPRNMAIVLAGGKSLEGVKVGSVSDDRKTLTIVVDTDKCLGGVVEKDGTVHVFGGPTLPRFVRRWVGLVRSSKAKGGAPPPASKL